MSNARKLIDDLQKKELKQQEQTKPSEWGKCSVSNCPLHATIKADNATCGYHYNQHGFIRDAITKSIIENKPYLHKFYQLTQWSLHDWKVNETAITGWHVLPMRKNESFTMYLNRFKTFVDEKILSRANEIIEHGENVF